MKHRSAALFAVVTLGCFPAETEFFGDPPPGHELVGSFSDTALVRNLDVDSVSAEGVRWLAFAAAESGRAGRSDIADRMSGLSDLHISAVPDSMFAGDASFDLWNRLGSQGLVQRMNLARADALTISSVVVDTALISSVFDSVRVEHRWLVVVSNGQAWLDPTVGLPEVP